jgi:phosphatidylglycerol:prolipoprotein diacylglycerol transferase
LHALDLVGAVCPVGLGFGRIANFINGELLGEIVAKPGAPSPWWSVKFPQELVSGHPCERSPDQQAALETLASKFVGPRESLEDGYSHLIAIVQNHASSSHQEVMTKLEPLLAARYPSQLLQAATDGPILLAVLWWIWRKPRTPGIIGCWFMITYGVMRIITEVWRLPDMDVGDPRILGLSRGQWLSVAMVLVGFVGIAIIKARAKRLDIAPIGGWGVKTSPS